jgi:hypothetical protein
MPTQISMSKKSHKKLTVGDGIFTIDKNMRNYDNEPYFIAKDEQAKAQVEKIGIDKLFEIVSGKHKPGK